MNKLTLILAIVFSGMLGKAQEIKDVCVATPIYSDLESKEVIKNLRVNQSVIVLDDSTSNRYFFVKHKKHTGWVKAYNVTSAKRKNKAYNKKIRAERGALISRSRYSDGYVIEIYKKGNTYSTYINGVLDSKDWINY